MSSSALARRCYRVVVVSSLCLAFTLFVWYMYATPGSESIPRDQWMGVMSSNFMALPKDIIATPQADTRGCTRPYGYAEYKQLVKYLQLRVDTGADSKYHDQPCNMHCLLDIVQANYYLVDTIFSYSSEIIEPEAYNFSVSDINVRSCGIFKLCVDITEHPSDGSKSNGGSSFITETASVPEDKARATCTYEDHEDGTYTVCCPAIYHTQIINITAAYVNYGGFQGQMLQALPIFYEEVNVVELFHKNDIPFERTIAVLSDDVDNHVFKADYWKQSDAGHWKWYKNGKTLPTFSKSDLESCINDLYSGKTTVIGDSHVRAVYDYITNNLGANTLSNFNNRHGSRMWETHTFLWATFPENVVSFMKDLRFSSQEKHLLILDTGAWVLHIDGLMPFLLRVRAFIHYLAKFLKTIDKDYVTVVWQDMPSMQDYYSTRYDPVHWRNQFTAAALNAWVCDHVEAIGVNCVRFGEATEAFRNEAVCRGHYLCVTADNSTGPAGHNAMYQILNTACPLLHAPAVP